MQASLKIRGRVDVHHVCVHVISYDCATVCRENYLRSRCMSAVFIAVQAASCQFFSMLLDMIYCVLSLP